MPFGARRDDRDAVVPRGEYVREIGRDIGVSSPNLNGRSSSGLEREVIIGAGLEAPVGICLTPSPASKVVKNRVHLDLNPGGDASVAEREAEIERILSLGARRVEIGRRGDESWTVLADPDGKRVQYCLAVQRFP